MRLSQALREKLTHCEQRQEKVNIIHRDNAWPHVDKPDKIYLETLKWRGMVCPPDIFLRYCIVQVMLIPFDGKWSGWSAAPFMWRYKKMTWFLDSLKTRTLLPLLYISSARKMEKTVACNTVNNSFVTIFLQ